MKTYVYYLSYAHGYNNSFGFGALELKRSSIIDSFEDICSIQQALMDKENNIKNPIVLSFQLLRVDE